MQHLKPVIESYYIVGTDENHFNFWHGNSNGCLQHMFLLRIEENDP